MARAKQYNEKITALKAILSGNTDRFAPPTNHVVIEKEGGYYEVNGLLMNEQQYNEWKKSIGKGSKLLHILLSIVKGQPIENYSAAPLAQEKEKEEKKEVPTQEIAEPTPQENITERLIPYERHIEFNRMVLDKLFS